MVDHSGIKDNRICAFSFGCDINNKIRKEYFGNGLLKTLF